MRRWETSGLLQAVFCEQKGLKLAPFGYWRKPFPGTATMSKGGLRLVPVNSFRPADAGAGFREQTGAGLEITRDGLFDATFGKHGGS